MFGCNLKSLRTKYVVTNSRVLSAKILEHESSFAAYPHSIRSLVMELHQRLSGQACKELSPEEQEFIGLAIAERLDCRSYFKKAFELPGLRERVFRCLDELRLAGYTSVDLGSARIPNSVKLQSLAQLFEIYESELKARAIHDYPQVLKSVIEALQTGQLDALLKQADVIMPFFLDPRGMESSFVEVLKEKVKVFESDPKHPAVAYLGETAEKGASLRRFKDCLSAYLESRADSRPATALEFDPSFRLRAVLTPEHSVAEAFQWLHDQGGFLNAAAIVSPNYDSYAGVVYRICAKLSIPVYLSHGVLASEFAFFAKDFEKLEALRDTFDITGSATAFLMEAESYFRKRRCETLGYDGFRAQALAFIRNYRAALEAAPEGIASNLSHAWKLFRSELLDYRLSSADLGLDKNALFYGRPEDLLGVKVDELAIIGLQDHNYPPKVAPDAILTDAEREELNRQSDRGAWLHDLSTSHPKEVQKDVLEKIVLGVKNAVYLSYDSHDLSKGDLSLPSSFLNRVLNAFGHEQKTEALYRLSGLPTTFVPSGEGNLFLDYETNLAMRGETSERFPGWVEAVRRQREWAVNSEDYAQVDATIAQSLLKQDLSPSSLAEFYKCPYRYYLKKVVGIRPIETPRTSSLEWLDSSQRGSFLHRAFEELALELIQGKPSAKNWTRLLAAKTEADIDQLLKRIAKEDEFAEAAVGVPAAVIEAEMEEFAATVQEFIRREIEDTEATGFYPIKAEEEFKGVAYEDPTTGVKLSFHGYIDRVDANGKGAHRVVDYKTGKNYLKKAKHLFKGGDYVYFQHVVYGLWALGKTGLAADKAKLTTGYYFSSDTGEWARVERPFTEFEAMAKAAFQVFHEQVSKGEFAKNAASCRFCDYKMVCGGIQSRRQKIPHKPEQLALLEQALNLEALAAAPASSGGQDE